MATTQDTELVLGLKGGSSLTGESGKQILSDLQGILSNIEKSGAAKLKLSVDTGSTGTAADAVKSSFDTVTESLKNNLIPLISDTQAGLYGLFGDLVKNLDDIPAKLAVIAAALSFDNVGNMPAYAPLPRCA